MGISQSYCKCCSNKYPQEYHQQLKDKMAN